MVSGRAVKERKGWETSEKKGGDTAVMEEEHSSFR
jgi:hypothetical protein